MDSARARGRTWLHIALAIGLWGCLIDQPAAATPPPGQVRKRQAQTQAAASGSRDVRSQHFWVHTDLAADEANRLVARLESLLQLISTYWGRPLQGVVECYVVRDIDTFPVAGMDPAGIQAIRTVGGMTVMRTASDGARYLAKSIVYADGRPEVVQHELVHAYCHHTFGRIGPVWYSEGMAEMAHYWSEVDTAVHADAREVKFLRDNPPRTLTEALSPLQVTGDSWQNYASRWALCHFLIHAPNYSPRFRTLGRGLLAGQNVSFEQAFGSTAHELSFEYRFFLEHIGPGYSVDRTAWEWNKEFGGLHSGRVVASTIAAGRGWQPSGLTISSGVNYQYATTGTCRIAGGVDEVDANGDDRGRGRLVGVLLNDYRLGEEFELGTKGSLQLPAGGNLYLRCRNTWSDLAADSGRLSVRLKLQGRSLRE